MKRGSFLIPRSERQVGLTQLKVGLLVEQEPLSLDGSLTARTSGTDGLTVGRVSTVASYEDAWQLCAWGAVNLLQVAHLVGLQPLLELSLSATYSIS